MCCGSPAPRLAAARERVWFGDEDITRWSPERAHEGYVLEAGRLAMHDRAPRRSGNAAVRRAYLG